MMQILSQKRYSDIVEAWNTKMRRDTAKAQWRRDHAATCRQRGHEWAISPLTTKDGERVLVCTRCIAYTNEEKRTA